MTGFERGRKARHVLWNCSYVGEAGSYGAGMADHLTIKMMRTTAVLQD
jgi:hypothetical protein